MGETGGTALGGSTPTSATVSPGAPSQGGSSLSKFLPQTYGEGLQTASTAGTLGAVGSQLAKPPNTNQPPPAPKLSPPGRGGGGGTPPTAAMSIQALAQDMARRKQQQKPRFA